MKQLDASEIFSRILFTSRVKGDLQDLRNNPVNVLLWNLRWFQLARIHLLLFRAILLLASQEFLWCRTPQSTEVQNQACCRSNALSLQMEVMVDPQHKGLSAEDYRSISKRFKGFPSPMKLQPSNFAAFAQSMPYGRDEATGLKPIRSSQYSESTVQEMDSMAPGCYVYQEQGSGA